MLSDAELCRIWKGMMVAMPVLAKGQKTQIWQVISLDR